MITGTSWKQFFCSTFDVETQTPKLYSLSVLYILAYFSRTPSWSVFCRSGWCSVSLSTPLVPKVALVAVLEALKNDAKHLRQFGKNSEM